MKNQKLALIGATGFVGGAILEEAIGRGYLMVAIARNTAKIAVESPALEKKELDVADEAALAEALKGVDTVISAYNPGWKNPDIYRDTMTNYPKIISVVKKAGIKRLQIVGGAGSLLLPNGKRVMDGNLPEEIRGGVESLAEIFYRYLQPEKELDWVFFSPAGSFTSGRRTGEYRLGTDLLIVGKDGKSSISVKDYAKAMVDEAENPQHHRERFTIGY